MQLIILLIVSTLDLRLLAGADDVVVNLDSEQARNSKENSVISNSDNKEKTLKEENHEPSKSFKNEEYDQTPTPSLSFDENSDGLKTNNVDNENKAIEIEITPTLETVDVDKIIADPSLDKSENNVLNQPPEKSPNLPDENEPTQASNPEEQNNSHENPSDKVKEDADETMKNDEGEKNNETELDTQAKNTKIEENNEEELIIALENNDDLSSFDEWKKIESEKLVKKQTDTIYPKYTTSTKKPPNRSTNYAAAVCGAKILGTNPEAQNSASILTENLDAYMNQPCSVKKWFIIELCEQVQMTGLDIANIELFSSIPESFEVLISESDRYPTKDWISLGIFHNKEERSIQHFKIEEDGVYTKFIKVELMQHFGKEHFCPISILRVYGKTVIDDDDDIPDNNENQHIEDVQPDIEGIGEGDVNFFDQARNTVIKIVKSVLPMPANTKPEFDQNDIHTDAQDNQADEKAVSNKSDGNDNATTVESQVYPITNITSEPDSNAETFVNDKESISDEDKSQFSLKPFISIDVLLQHCDVCIENRNESCFKMSEICSYYIIMRQKYLFSCKEGKIVLTSSSVNASEKISIDMPIDTSESHPIETLSVDFSSLNGNDLQDKQTLQEEMLLITPTSTDFTAVDFTSSIMPTMILETIDEIKFTQKDITETSISNSSENILQTTLPFSKDDNPYNDENINAGAIKPTPTIDDSLYVSKNTDDISIQQVSSLEHTQVPSLDVNNTDMKYDNEENKKEEKNGFDQASSNQENVITSDGQSPDSIDHVSDSTLKSDEKISEKDVKELLDDVKQAEVVSNNLKNIYAETIKDDLDLVYIAPPESDEQIIKTAGKKQSTFIILKNRIKNLEENLNLSSRYLEELSRRYRKQMEEMYTSLNKTITRLSNTSKKMEERQERIINLEKQVANLTEFVKNMSVAADVKISDAFERHLVLTIILIFVFNMTFSWCISRNRNKNLSNSVHSQAVDAKYNMDTIPTEQIFVKRTHKRSVSEDFGVKISNSTNNIPALNGNITSRWSDSETNYDIVAPALPVFLSPTKVTESGLPKKRKKNKGRRISSEAQTNNIKGTSISEDDINTSAGVLFQSHGRGSNSEQSDKSLYISNIIDKKKRL